MPGPCCSWAPASPLAGQARPAAVRVADRGREEQGPELSSRWLGQLGASLPGSMELTGWSWKNDKCLLRARSEWLDHKPQGWTRAALLCLGLGPRALRSVCEARGWTPEKPPGTRGAASPWERALGAWEGSTSQKRLQACQTTSMGPHLWHLTSRQAMLQIRENGRANDNWVPIPALLPAGAKTLGP